MFKSFFRQKNNNFIPINTLSKDLNVALSLIVNCGMKPKLIIDVGAHKGTWTSVVQNIFPNSKFLLIEPQNLPISQDLVQKNVEWMRIGLGPADQTATFYDNVRDDSSSFIINNPKRVLGHHKVSMRRLDSLIRELRLNIPDIVKLDCEGYDLEVLKGFGDLLGKIPFIFVECGIANPFLRNDILECVSFMKLNNYLLVNIGEAARLGPSWAMWNAELLFVLNHSKFSQVILNPVLD